MIIKHYMPKGPNVGDTIIDLSVKKILYSIFPEANIFSFRSHKHAAFYSGLITIGQRDRLSGINKDSIDFFKKPDLIVVGGAPTWGTSSLVDINPIDIIKAKIPIAFIGAGSKYYPNPSNRLSFMTNIEKIKDQIIISSARDGATYESMNNHGLNSYMTGCPVMHYIGKRIRRKDSDYFIISYRQSKDLRKIRIDQRFIKKLEEVIGAKHLIVFHDYREVHTMNEIKGNLNYIVEYNPENLIPLYTNAKFVLAYRLHGTLLSTTCGTQYLQVGNDKRCSDFTKTFDPEEKHNVSHIDLSKDNIIERIKNIILKRGKYDYADYQEKIKEAKNNLEIFKKELKSLLA